MTWFHAGIALIVLSAALSLFLHYCIYRLWAFGPYNANTIFGILSKVLHWPTPILAGIGVWICYDIFSGITIAIVWFFFLNLSLAFHTLWRQKRKFDRETDRLRQEKSA